MNKIQYAALVLLFCAAASTQAQTSDYPPARYRQATADYVQTPHNIVRQGLSQLRDFLYSDARVDPTQITEFLDRTIAPYFDFPYMVRWVGGPLNRHLNDRDKVRFSTKLQALFFTALSRNLGVYANNPPRIRIFRPRPRQNMDREVVQARVIPARGYPLDLKFHFYRSVAGWKIFDVSVNDVSAVSFYRTYFRRLAGRGGIAAVLR